MLGNNNDDSSSSEDEISKDALREATDHQFLKDSYFLNQKSEDSNIPEKNCKHNNLIENKDSTNPVSLRKNLEQQDQFSNFGVSPSFQNYVARKLDEIIEKSIRIKKKEISINGKESEDNSYGVKLLSSSVEYLTGKEEDEELQKPRKKRKIETTINDKESLLKCREVSVEPERILSKAETEAWTSRRNEPEFKYKRLTNGTLVEKT